MKYRNTEGYKYTVEEQLSIPVPLLAVGNDQINPGQGFGREGYYYCDNGVLTIAKGYSWDGASGPTWDSPDTLTPSLVHDVLYQAIREGVLDKKFRFEADLTFYKLMRDRTISMWGHTRAFYFFVGVRLFGWLSVRPKKGGEQQEHVLEVL